MLLNEGAADDVALRKESVDRNNNRCDDLRKGGVALRKESVDRNNRQAVAECRVNASLSARRAWIEMDRFQPVFRRQSVALRKESVDRNHRGSRI